MTGGPGSRFALASLKAEGFRGFVAVRELREGKLEEIPEEHGVYIVLLPDSGKPRYLTGSTGGSFKGKDASVPRDKLEVRWIKGVRVLYIGRACRSSARPRRSGLRFRVGQLLDFGAGRPIRHWGGRYIWQIQAGADLLVAWKALPSHADPADEERGLLEAFEGEHGQLPFANLRRGDRARCYGSPVGRGGARGA